MTAQELAEYIAGELDHGKPDDMYISASAYQQPSGEMWVRVFYEPDGEPKGSDVFTIRITKDEA